MIVCTACNVLSLCCVTGTYVWRQMLKTQLKNLFICKCHQKRVHQCEEVEEETSGQRYKMNTSVKNTDGVPLAFNVREEADIYFKQLTALWDQNLK